MKRHLLALSLSTLLLALCAAPAAAHAFIDYNLGSSVPSYMSLFDLSEDTSLLLSAGFGWTNGEFTDWDVTLGLRLYNDGDALRSYEAFSLKTMNLNFFEVYSYHGLQGVFGYEYRLGQYFQVMFFVEAGLCLAVENNGPLAVNVVYGLGLGLSMWVY